MTTNCDELTPKQIQCTRCKKEKDEAHFRKMGERLTRLCGECRATALAKFHAHNGKHRGKYTRMAKDRCRLNRQRVLQRYGGKCACCGEADLRFLSLDHVNDDGAAHRKALSVTYGGYAIISWAIRNNCPPSLQALCFNCNCGKQVNGGVCPHKSAPLPLPKELIVVPRRGETHVSKVSEDDVREIRRRHAAGETLRAISGDYPVTYINVWHIVRRKTWKHVA